MKYFFILGNHPALSRAEIESVIRRLKINGQITAAESSFVFFETDNELNAAELITQLGGTIKIGHVLDTIDELNAEALTKFVPISDKKIIFGISNYNLKFDLQKIGLNLKHLIKKQGGTSRFVTSQEYPLSSVIVQKELLNKGLELVIMKTGGQLHVGKTLAVQPFELYSKIDYGRPNRDAKGGMLPPKLAQIMVNLAEQPLDATILDPFCGSGTILQQAAMLGFARLSGSDSSGQAVTDTRANLDWLKRQANVRFDCEVTRADAKFLTQTHAPRSVDAIITEPYLGPALRGGESVNQLKKTAAAIGTLYKDALIAMAAVLKPKGALIIVIPEFNAKARPQRPSKLMLTMAGGDEVISIPLEPILPPGLKITGRWRYARPDQKVIRGIYKIIKT